MLHRNIFPEKKILRYYICSVSRLVSISLTQSNVSDSPLPICCLFLYNFFVFLFCIPASSVTVSFFSIPRIICLFAHSLLPLSSLYSHHLSKYSVIFQSSQSPHFRCLLLLFTYTICCCLSSHHLSSLCLSFLSSSISPSSYISAQFSYFPLQSISISATLPVLCGVKNSFVPGGDCAPSPGIHAMIPFLF
jgi:hypothetical protein